MRLEVTDEADVQADVLADSAADVCLILEGTYPFVAGGVSSWTHDLIRGLPEIRFHLLTLLAPTATSLGATRSPTT